MVENNNWHNQQPRSQNSRFSPRWDKDTVIWIIDQIKQMTDFVDIQYRLVKDKQISLATAALWIEMSRRIMDDMNNGLTIEQALERDKERRNDARRKRA